MQTKAGLGIAPMYEGISMVMLQPESFVKVGDGILEQPESAFGSPPVIVGIDIVTFQQEGPVEIHNRLLELTTLDVGGASANGAGGNVGPQLESLFKFGDGLIVLTELKLRDTLFEKGYYISLTLVRVNHDTCSDKG